MDFSLNIYKKLLQSFIEKNYSFQTFEDFIKSPAKRVIILRHDVEKRSNIALDFAQIEDSLNIKGTYYFKFSDKGINTEVLKQIVDLGHEIGYHYDDLAVCKGDYTKAIQRFESNMSFLRRFATVNTICMDGSPLSLYDNKMIWKKFNYSDFGIIGEPYFDVNYEDVLYLTDTGRRWDGYEMSFRDKIDNAQKRWIKEGLIFNSTNDIIKSINSNSFPNKALMTFHPQRWTDSQYVWMKEYIFQNFKNIIKYIVLKFLKKGSLE